MSYPPLVEANINVRDMSAKSFDAGEFSPQVMLGNGSLLLLECNSLGEAWQAPQCGVECIGWRQRDFIRQLKAFTHVAHDMTAPARIAMNLQSFEKGRSSD